MKILKHFSAKTPLWFQEELRRLYYRNKIKKGTFISPEPEFDALSKFARKGDWVIDIGANIGHYTIKLSNLVGEKGRVIAFEPIPSTFTRLSENTSYSKYKNITLINTAVSDKAALVGMSIPNFTTGLKNYYQASISSEHKETDTSVLTLSIDELHISNKISLIKIDAEGHEPIVFRGMYNLIERDRPVLIVETVTDEIRDHLIQLGYSEDKYKNSPNIVFKSEM